MREMKFGGDDSIGMIPASWGSPRLKYHCIIKNGSDPKTDGTIPVYGSGKEIVKYCGESKVGPAILLGRKGTLDKPKYIEGEFWNVDTAMDCYPQNGIVPKYLYYVTTIFDINKYSTSTAKPSMTQSDYYNMTIPFPLPDEQAAIVNYIESQIAKVDNAIARHKQIIEKLEEYKRSVITHAVTKGLNPDVEMKDSGVEWVGTIPEQWQTIKLKFVTTIRNEKGHFNPKTDKYVGLENIEGYSGRYIETATQYTEAEYNICKKGDIVFNKLRPYLTKAMEIPFDCFCTNELIVFSSFEGNSKYLLYLLLSDSFIDNVNASTYGAKMPRANPDFVRNIEIPIPSKSEQNTIVLYLDNMCKKIDEAITRQKAAIEKLEEYRKSIIYNAVTGKIDCRATPE